MNGKIIPSELINRKNNPDTKECIGFEYELLVDDGNNKITFPIRFTRLGERTWSVEMVFKSQVYQIMYDVPTPNMDLVMVAAFGLRNLQFEIEQEIQMKSIIDFSIGDVIKEM